MPSSSERKNAQARAFAYLRRRNEYAARVTEMLEANRKRRIAQAIRAQRQQRLHQAR